MLIGSKARLREQNRAQACALYVSSSLMGRMKAEFVVRSFGVRLNENTQEHAAHELRAKPGWEKEHATSICPLLFFTAAVDGKLWKQNSLSVWGTWAPPSKCCFGRNPFMGCDGSESGADESRFWREKAFGVGQNVNWEQAMPRAAASEIYSPPKARFRYDLVRRRQLHKLFWTDFHLFWV